MFKKKDGGNYFHVILLINYFTVAMVALTVTFFYPLNIVASSRNLECPVPEGAQI